MKKVLSLVLGLLAVASLAGCSGQSIEDVREIATNAMNDDQSIVVDDVVGIVSAIHYSTYNGALSEQGCYLTDKTGTIYVYGFALAQEVKVGDKVNISAVTASYYGGIQLSGPTLNEIISSGNSIPTNAVVKGKDIAYLNTLSAVNAGETFEVTGKVTIDSYGNYYISDDAGNSFLLYASEKSGTNDRDTLGYPEFAFLDDFKDKTGTFVVVVNGTNTSGTVRGHVISAK